MKEERIIGRVYKKDAVKEVSIHGIKGGDCLKYTEIFRKMGDIIEDQKTEEFFENINSEQEQEQYGGYCG